MDGDPRLKIFPEVLVSTIYRFAVPFTDPSLMWSAFLPKDRLTIIGPKCSNETCPCPPRQVESRPLRLIYFAGNDADFMGTLGPTVCRLSIAEELAERFGGIDAHPIEILPAKKLRPYKGEELRELLPTRELLHEDLLDGYNIVYSCDTCHRRYVEPVGAEKPPAMITEGPPVIKSPRVLREPGAGFLFRKGIFDANSIAKFQSNILVGTNVAQYVIERGWTNVELYEIGETIS